MHRRVFRRAAVAAFSLLIAASVAAFADNVSADGDNVTAGDQSTIDLGAALPGADVNANVWFVLRCSGTNHVNRDQMVRLLPAIRSIPPGGSFSVGSLMFGVPATWPADGDACPAGGDPVIGGPMHIVVTAPPTVGDNYHYSFSWSRNLFPTTDTDPGTYDGLNPAITFVLDVVDNTPPVLHLPSDRTIEATSPAGATTSWTATATDAEDATAPPVDCDPASGSTFPLGTTTVNCSATDGGGLTTSGSFQVTVQDTTAPAWPNRADVDVTTADPAGAVVDIGFPTVFEAVDPNPSASCSPSSGLFPVGTTTVRCTATDHSGNTGTMSFKVTVRYVPAVTWTALWGEPVATGGTTFVANAGRTVPVKVRLFANGVEQTRGAATLSLATCDGTAISSMAMTWSGGRWNVSLDTSALGPSGCYAATASLDGHAAGSFQIDLRGADAQPVRGTKAPKI
jgi:hypothetical protein